MEGGFFVLRLTSHVSRSGGILGLDRRDEACRETAIEQRLHRPPALRAILPGPIVDIHAHEAIRLRSIETSRVPHRVRKRVLPVGQTELDRPGEDARDSPDALGTE